MPYPDPQHFKITMLFPMRYPSPYGSDLIPKHVWDWWLGEITTILKGGTDSGIVEGWWRKEWDASRMVFAIVSASELETILGKSGRSWRTQRLNSGRKPCTWNTRPSTTKRWRLRIPIDRRLESSLEKEGSCFTRIERKS